MRMGPSGNRMRSEPQPNVIAHFVYFSDDRHLSAVDLMYQSAKRNMENPRENVCGSQFRERSDHTKESEKVRLTKRD